MKCMFCLANIDTTDDTCPECGKSFINNDSKHHKNYLEAAYRKINEKIDRLLDMNKQMKGFLFLTRHKYSIKDLLESPEMQRIESLMKKIHDDITQWQNANKLSIKERYIYNFNRDELEDKLANMEDSIINREKTFWEKVCDVLKKLCDWIIKYLPKIWSGLSLFANKVPLLEKVLKKVGQVLGLFLVGKNNKYIT